MKHLDFTIDFETVGLTANAAPMMVAIVPWNRDAKEDPFTMDEDGTLTEEQTNDWPEPLELYVDLRSCVVEGYDFDPETVEWWTKQSQEAKRGVCKGLAKPVDEVTAEIVNYLRRAMEQLHLDSICLWSQGPDVDIAILRNLCRKYDVNMEDIVPHTQFRDCRTVILEAALIEAERSMGGTGIRARVIVMPHQILAGSYDVYKMFAPLPDRYAAGSEAHDALYDVLRSSWNTWQALQWMRG